MARERSVPLKFAPDSEQATRVGMGSQLEQLQKRLILIQDQLANREKELIAVRYHIVREGETLDSISRKYGLTVKELERLNDFPTNRNYLFFRGQKLIVQKSYAKQKTITNSIGMKFVLIPAGNFTMGSELSPEEVARRCGGQAEWYK